MTIHEVKTDKQAEEFLLLPLEIYKDDPNWIRPLDDDINKVFDRNKNKFFKQGDLCRWLLKDDNGKCIGRVAAFVNEQTANSYKQPTGGMGFFECVDEQEAANMLFDQCKKWLEEQGMEAMDGPINFGERNMWWGLLVEGFDEPCYGMNYNPQYYRGLFESYGFKLYYNQYSFGLGMDVPRPQKYYERSRELMKDPDYSWKHLEISQIEKFTEDFRYIYNKAFVGREAVKPMTAEQATNLMKNLKPILVDYLIWFGYYKDEPIALFFMMPELNQFFKHVNGKMNLLGKMKFLYHKWTGSVRKVYAFLFGVIPEFQHKGVEGGIIIAANNIVQPKKRWDNLELIWIGDFNPKMVTVAKNLGAEAVKTHITFRKLFDETIPFERRPMEY